MRQIARLIYDYSQSNEIRQIVAKILGDFSFVKDNDPKVPESAGCPPCLSRGEWRKYAGWRGDWWFWGDQPFFRTGSLKNLTWYS